MMKEKEAAETFVSVFLRAAVLWGRWSLRESASAWPVPPQSVSYLVRQELPRCACRHRVYISAQIPPPRFLTCWGPESRNTTAFNNKLQPVPTVNFSRRCHINISSNTLVRSCWRRYIICVIIINPKTPFVHQPGLEVSAPRSLL